MKIRNFTLLALAVFLSAAVFVFAQNGTPLKYSSKELSERTMTLGEMQQAKPAPEGLVEKVFANSNRAQAHRAGSAVDLAGDYTWDFEVANSYQDATAERTAYTGDVTISATSEGYTISGMFPNDLSATIDEYGYLVVDGSNAGSSSYGDYDVRGLFYYEGDDTYQAGWYFTDIYAEIGEDGVISFDNITWFIRILTTGDYAGYALSPYFAPGSTLTPANGGGGASITYDFDDSTMQGWTTIDADGDGHTWVLGSETGGEYLVEGASLAGSGHNGSNDFVTSGSYSNVYGALTPDNYLVSPKVALGGKISFYACGQDASYVAEHFGVAVSIAGNTSAADFKMLQDWTMAAAPSQTPALNAPQNAFRSPRRAQGNWYLYTVDLSAYAGLEGYVAIRHYNCTDMFLLDVDDITIEEPSSDAGFALEGISEHGTVTFTVDGKEVTKAEAGKTVTATVTPDDNFIVDEVVAHAFVDWDDVQAPQRIGIYKDVELTPAGDNAWTFTMPEASVEFLASYMKNVQLTVESGDITAALEAAAEGLPVNDLELTLKSGSEYTISNSMTVGGDVEIDGNGAKIDASALTGALIVLNGSKIQAANADGTENASYKSVDEILIKDVTINGLAQPVVRDEQKTLVNSIIVDNSVIELVGGKNVFDFNNTGYPAELIVNASTLWSKEGHTGYFLQTRGRVKDLDSDQTMYTETLSITKSTLYQISKGKQLNNLQGKGQKSLVFTLTDDLLYDCTQDGNEVRGWLGGQNSNNPVVVYNNNSYLSNGAKQAGWTDSS